METYKARILYAEDDVYLSFVTKDNLELKGFHITFCKDGKEAFKAFQNGSFDLCILDVMMPEMDGFTLARKIREINPQIPILFLSARSMKEDRITGLQAGADDYIIKPFSIEELILKIEIFLKRSRISDPLSKRKGVIAFGNYIFDTINYQLSCNEKTIRLTSRESELLEYFADNRNKVLKKDDILTAVWESDSYFNSRSLDVFVSKLRKYLRDDPAVQLNNVHGIGFVFSVPD